MRLRYASDVRTLLWTFVLTPALAALLYARPALVPYLSWVSCYFALACGVIAHNHNHCPTFESKRANSIFAGWISIFYGYPTFAWIPTHNLNHHKFVNKAGDATITWRFTNKNNALVGITYFFVSSYYQSGPIKEFIRKAKAGNPKLYRQIVTQYVVWAGAHLGLFALALAIHGPKTGLYVYVFAFALPAFFALWTIMFFNYGQHVHTDPWSKHNHSRTFNGRLLNFLLFNNGLHTVHHEHASAHWSTMREIHEKIAPEIHPELNLRSFWWWVIRSFFLAPIFPSMGTKQIGRAPFDTESPRTAAVETATIGEAVEAGINAPMV
ncbi:MAG: fatty acid desaturase [Myxococcales bacterium]|nr:fatty acid desaturase [Myxococcales bacterium]